MSLAHWVALAVTAGLGGRTLTRLLQRFGSLEEAITAPAEALLAIPHIGPRTVEAIRSTDLSKTQAEIEGFRQQGIQIVTWEDAGYPSNLLHAPDAPPVLFVRGQLRAGDARAAAIIGTREPSAASAALAQRIAAGLAGQGWTIVSGLALGIDTAAHQGALAAGGRTLAVLGSGVLNTYPQRNAALADAVSQQGAVLSEVHPLASVSRQSLVARNRITSGLSRAVIVVQSGADGGSVHTARCALKQGRAVFAAGGSGGDRLMELGAALLPADEIDWERFSVELDRLPIQPASRGQEHGEQPSLF